MRLLKSQLEQVQEEAANLKLRLTTAQDESGSAKQEVTCLSTLLLIGFSTLTLACI